ncbi:hypothetical protein FZEAL_8690 [Fusarium zealandicum]|uniref:Glycolipid 2-alpha-mannosyltransferase n=1 Tax=Fusarium zealandicum TaxID=1053134 RepID=A0A8H4UDU0_9HYPO|nr:hypothetical protein FZEAL_8690 [Fusarium zealandicum]
MARRSLSFHLWAWALALVYLTTFVRGHTSSSYADTAPRAALVSLAHDHDLPAMLFSMQQLEDKFNSRYHYHWVFFSTQELGDDFKQRTSNATNATCIYEVIPDENWSIPGWTDQSQISTSRETTLDYDSETLRPMANIRQMNRWNSAPFAKERRMRDYDWFWRVEPGAQLTQDIPFDVFRFMRDNGIAYGFNRAILGQTSLRALSPRIKSFVDQHPGLLHEEAAISWLLDNNTDSVTHQAVLRDDAQDFHDGRSEADLSQDEIEDDHLAEQEDDEGSFSLSECFASWLSGIYGSSLYPTFEIGSLAFFRSPNHVAFFDHLDSAGDFEHRRVDDVPVHTFSASMFLPRQSVWNFRNRDLLHRTRHGQRLSQPKATPDPEWNDNAARIAEWKGDRKQAKEAFLAYWGRIALDMNQQNENPKMRSGNTEIQDELQRG